ncbi:heme/hemin ABC transporter substrate-binding protein [Rhodoflexus caldus]|uniref:heme/hemin ABC transporter substrate-binding protein n=1 Tax=Rhodoflexus caldus TaxID=2891236 RepID=UPI00202AAD95|nr:ABC transporter substrate-binding protein [Rhodoflexus caldus]
MRQFILQILLISCLINLIQAQTNGERIVSASGTISEILCELGLEKNIAGVDVTSTYPESLQKVPKIGHNRNISAEGILALRPTVFVGIRSQLSPALEQQLKAAGIKTLLYEQEYSLQGTQKLIRQVAADFNLAAQGNALAERVGKEVAALKKPATRKKVLFIYARGAGSLMVAGKNTSVAQAIEMAGGENAANDFNDFKPLTAESLLQANPDVILLFSSGLQSLGGINGLLQVQGVAQTNAGKNRKIVEMDGQLLTGFSPRLGKALQELADKIR